MYDFRQDVKDLIDLTDNTPQSLKQTAKSLMIIGCAFLENEQLNDSVKLVKNKVVADKAKPNKLKTKNTTESVKKPISLDSSSQNKLINIYHKYGDQAYLAKQALAGYDLIDSNNNSVGFYSESLARYLSITNGDILSLDLNTTGKPRYIKTLDHIDYPNNIINFDKGIVEYNDIFKQLVISHNIYQKQLGSVNSKHAFYKVDPGLAEKFNISENSIADLAWEKDDPENIQIRWVHNTDKAPNTSKIDKIVSQPVKEFTEIASTPKSIIDLDLTYLDNDIAIVSGDSSVTSNITDYFKTNYQTNVTPISFEHSASTDSIINKLAKFDVIILIKNYISHNMSQSIIQNLSDKNIAVSNSAGQKSIAMAVYRAINNLSYDDNSDIDYPEIIK